eukprot:614497-Amphidinium_carterae.4
MVWELSQLGEENVAFQYRSGHNKSSCFCALGALILLAGSVVGCITTGHCPTIDTRCVPQWTTHAARSQLLTTVLPLPFQTVRDPGRQPIRFLALSLPMANTSMDDTTPVTGMESNALAAADPQEGIAASSGPALQAAQQPQDTSSGANIMDDDALPDFDAIDNIADEALWLSHRMDVGLPLPAVDTPS